MNIENRFKRAVLSGLETIMNLVVTIDHPIKHKFIDQKALVLLELEKLNETPAPIKKRAARPRSSLQS